MRALLCVVLVVLGPVTEGAQRRPMGAVPPSQAVSTLTTATSLGLVAAGARTALDRGSSATRCVTGVAASPRRCPVRLALRRIGSCRRERLRAGFRSSCHAGVPERRPP